MAYLKKSIAILCGGQSAEHEVSLESAKNVIAAIDREHYNLYVIFITLKGQWFLLDSEQSILRNETMQPLKEPWTGKPILLELGSDHPFCIKTSKGLLALSFDLIFPVLHGTYAEDGTLQGLLELAHIPYVGTRTLGSAICMDKAITKQLLQQAGIPVAKGWVVRGKEAQMLSYKEVTQALGTPIFIKPANAGSSKGVSKVRSEEEFIKGLALAQRYDNKLVVEAFIEGREIECAVLGNYPDMETSLPGEIILKTDFYSYEAKYLNPEDAILSTPAVISKKAVVRIQALSKQAFSILQCEGLARMDFLMTSQGEIFFNEANTLPGFTQISQYPKMWQVSGFTYAELIDRLIWLGLQNTVFSPCHE